MKTRTALVVVTVLLFTISAFADDPPRARGGRDQAGKIADLQDRYDRTPKKAFIFDGVEFPAATRLPDVGLTWVITREDHKNNTFHLFTSHEVAQAFMKKRTSGAATNGTLDRDVTPNWPGGCSWTNTYTRFEKSRWCGDAAWLSMYPSSGQYTQLDSISWNNSISCVYAACDWYWTVLYSCRDFDMTPDPNCQNPSRLYIEGGLIVGDLDDFGFNNETSSTRFE
ncbi:MAG TPA: hypothetical protein VEK57_16140 [Thermoanaerobaculia bacterium]|nr:hypothetical protein [Thermoanaerobaculia bacterium]